MGVVITVSRQLGSQGSYIATMAAQTLGFRYLDREVLHRAAEIAGFPDPQMVRALEEREEVPGLLQRVFDALGSMPAVPSVPSATMREGGYYADLVNEVVYQESVAVSNRERAAANYLDLVRKVISRVADEDNAVVVGRGGQVILAHRRNAFHVRVFASLETRVRILMARDELSREAAEQDIRRSDRNRARYLQRYHDVDWEDPRLYHLQLNTDLVPVAMGTNAIVAAARWLAESLR